MDLPLEPKQWHHIVGCPLRFEGCLPPSALGTKRKFVIMNLTFRARSEEAVQFALAQHLEACHNRDFALALTIARNQVVEVCNDDSSSSGDESCKRIKTTDSQEAEAEPDIIHECDAGSPCDEAADYWSRARCAAEVQAETLAAAELQAKTYKRARSEGKTKDQAIKEAVQTSTRQKR